MKTLQFIQDPATLVPLSDTPPAAEFSNLVAQHGGRIAETVCAAKQKQPRLKDFQLRMGMVFPPNTILDEEIRRLCKIPFRHQAGGVFGCEGVVEGWKGCPPRSPGVAETVANLKTARAMLLLQFDGIQDHHLQKYINRFTKRLTKRLQDLGLHCPGSYGCGPCTQCEKGCDPQEECRLPEEHTYALESCGFWITHLCRMAAQHPLGQDAPQDIQWVTDWNLPGQSPKTFKSVTGVLIG